MLEFTETLDCMMDAIEAHNLIFQVPVPPSVDSVGLAWPAFSKVKITWDHLL